MSIKFELLKVGHCNHLQCIAFSGSACRKIQFPSLCALITHPQKGYILYDTGYSPHFQKSTSNLPEFLYRIITPVHLPIEEELINQLKERDITANEISYIIISHFHADHIAGLKDFPNARFIAGSDEFNAVNRQPRFGRLRRAFLRTLLPADFDERVTFIDDLIKLPLNQSLRPFTIGFDLFGDQSIIGIDLPGHTEFQLGIFFEQKFCNFFLIGDAAWSMQALELNQPATWVASQIFANRKQYLETFNKLRQLLHQKNNQLQIIPSHCQRTWQDYRN